MISINLICKFIETAVWHECSPVNLSHIFQNPFFQNTFEGLLLQCIRTWYIWSLLNYVPYVPRDLSAFVPQVPCALRAVVSHVFCALRTLVSHVLLCLTCPSCPVLCVLRANQYHLFCSFFPRLQVTFSYLFPTREFFREIYLKIICR